MKNHNDTAAKAVVMQRDALMTLLIAQVTDLIQQLALLAGSEKTAVARLVAIGQAMAHYTRSANADPQVIAGFDHVLGAFSPLLSGRADAAMARDTYLEQSGAGSGVRQADRHMGNQEALHERDATAGAMAETECLIQYLKALQASMAPSSVHRERMMDASVPLASRGG